MIKIKQINIYQFGRFTGRSIQLPAAPFLIVYGPNEAGKSTLTAFIKYMLFGFPPKAKLDAFVRNRDINGVGGSLHIESETFGGLKLERFLNESGMPKVYDNTGSDNGSHQLNQLFYGLDLPAFEAIFCFDLDGLKELEKIGAKEMNQLLFSAGMTGNSRIMRLEQMLDKKLQALFKPSGRKPVINQTITELDHLKGQLKDWDKKLNDYHDINEKIQQAEREIADILEKKREIENTYHQLAQFSSLKPLMIKYNSLHEEEKQLPDINFPDQGIERLEKWQAQIVVLEGEKAEISKRIEQISLAVRQLNIDRKWLDNERNLLHLINKAPYCESLRQNIDMTKEKILYEANLLDNLINKLGGGWTKEAVCAADIGIESKDHLKQLLNEREKAMHHRDRLEQALSDSMAKTERFQEQIAQSKQYVLDEAERSRIEEQLEASKNRDMLEKEKSWLEAKIQSIHRERRQKSQLKKLSIIIPGSCLVLSVFIAFLQFYSHHPISGFISGAFGVILSLGAKLAIQKTADKTSGESDETEADQRLKTINEILLARPQGELYEYQTLLNKDEEARASIASANQRLEDEKKYYGHLIQQLDNVSLSIETNTERLREWMVRHSFLETPVSLIEEVYQYVEEAKTHVIQQQQLEKQLNGHKQKIDAFEREKYQLAEQLQAENDSLWHLEQRLNKEKEKHQRYLQFKHQLQGLIEQEEALNEKMSRYQTECERLFKAAQVNDEEAFRKKAKKYERKKQIQSEMLEVKRQMEQIEPNRASLQQCHLWLREDRFKGVTKESLKKQIEELEQRLETCRKQSLKWQSERSQLEENQSYAQLKHQMEAKRSFLNEKARQWAVYQTARGLLNKAKEEYRERKLPAVLAQASEYFSKMTGYRYRAILMSDEEGLVAENYAGQSFYVKELSRGTQEQLYVSIRLALASVFESAESFPIIIDDSFVNFDNDRSGQAMAVLSEVSKRHQVILMTCHKEYKNQSDAAWISLADVEHQNIDSVMNEKGVVSCMI
ncbi:uncharacterized protein YhaN [Scopulibacillus daqui]|uniref:Uncharacterized protein YhaN n=1 Tax=Scopulibacillus daqui TaxID=1469162 RepID=A0ABS2Q3P3_9BACL|nr:AAA family ATPase [Scopulibacillus daqui]MBM7646921.1 uncharacterized protein YhaN [Scopulibacillus daqui]